MPLPLGASGIMFLGCLSIHLSSRTIYGMSIVSILEKVDHIMKALNSIIELRCQ